MWIDPIVEETRKARQEDEAKFDHDLTKIYNELKRSDQKRGRKVVSFASKKEPVGTSKH